MVDVDVRRGPGRIALLGTGLMGVPMTRLLAGAGYRMTVWNRTRSRAEALSDVAHVAEEPGEAVAEAGIVVAILMGGDASRAVLGEAMPRIPAGATILDMGTNDPATSRALGALSADHGVGYLDAPVSGGVAGAEGGTLSIFVGGDRDAMERLRPMLEVLGRPTHLGPVGAGQAAKLANQIIVAITIGAVAEGLHLAGSAGCDPAAVREALRGGFADSRILDLHGKRMVDRDYTPGGRAGTQLRDIDHALDLARSHDLDLPLGTAVRGAFGDLVERMGGADLDHSAYHLWLETRR